MKRQTKVGNGSGSNFGSTVLTIRIIGSDINGFFRFSVTISLLSDVCSWRCSLSVVILAIDVHSRPCSALLSHCWVSSVSFAAEGALTTSLNAESPPTSGGFAVVEGGAFFFPKRFMILNTLATRLNARSVVVVVVVGDGRSSNESRQQYVLS